MGIGGKYERKGSGMREKEGGGGVCPPNEKIVPALKGER